VRGAAIRGIHSDPVDTTSRKASLMTAPARMAGIDAADPNLVSTNSAVAANR
jgi:hypothetical protein